MKCAYHPEKEAVGVCVSCGRGICQEDLQVVKDRFFCFPCYKKRRQPLEKRKSPFWAGSLNFFPGLGHLYLGLWGWAGLLFSLFIFFEFLKRYGAPASWLIVGLLVFGVMDGYQKAQRLNASLEEEPVKDLPYVGRYIGAIFIAMGSLALIHQIIPVNLKFLRELWPLVFIGAGIWLLFPRKKNPINKEVNHAEV